MALFKSLSRFYTKLRTQSFLILYFIYVFKRTSINLVQYQDHLIIVRHIKNICSVEKMGNLFIIGEKIYLRAIEEGDEI